MTKEELIKKVIEEVQDEKLKNKILNEIIKKDNKEEKFGAKDIIKIIKDFNIDIDGIANISTVRLYIFFVLQLVAFLFGIFALLGGIAMLLNNKSFNLDNFLAFLIGISFSYAGLEGIYAFFKIKKYPKKLKKFNKLIN